MKERLIDLIIKKLTGIKHQLQDQFSKLHAIKVTRHFVVDDLLPIVYLLWKPIPLHGMQ